MSELGEMKDYAVDGVDAWAGCCGCGGGKRGGRRLLAEVSCADDTAAAAKLLGLPSDDSVCKAAKWNPGYCAVPDFARACAASCAACAEPPQGSVGDVAAKRRALSGDHDEELIPIYSTFHP